MSEARLFRAVVLTMITYGCVSFLQWGKFLVPLPAFELAILGLCLFFSIKSWKTNKIAALLLILFGISQFLGRSYNYEFFLSDVQLHQLSSTSIIDIFLIVSFIFLGALFVQQRRESARNMLISLVLALSIIVCGLIPDETTVLNILPLIIVVLLFNSKKELMKDQHSIWVLLLLFAVSRTLTLWLL